MKKWRIGIDPGFRQTGVVLMLGRKLKAYYVLSAPPGCATYYRAQGLAELVRGIVLSWIEEYRILTGIRIGIESPIYNKNPQTFEKQWRLFQAIETELRRYLQSFDGQYNFVEIPPTTSKRLATGDGDASKQMVLLKSPIRDLPAAEAMTLETRMTLADAWAHCVAAKEGEPLAVQGKIAAAKVVTRGFARK